MHDELERVAKRARRWRVGPLHQQAGDIWPDRIRPESAVALGLHVERRRPPPRGKWSASLATSGPGPSAKRRWESTPSGCFSPSSEPTKGSTRRQERSFTLPWRSGISYACSPGAARGSHPWTSWTTRSWPRIWTTARYTRQPAVIVGLLRLPAKAVPVSCQGRHPREHSLPAVAPDIRLQRRLLRPL